MRKILLILSFLLVCSTANAERLFQAASTWNTPVPTSPTVSSDSAAHILDIKANANYFIANYLEWSPSIIRVPADTPLVTVVADACARDTGHTHASCTTDVTTAQKQGWDHVPLPAGSYPAGNTAAVKCWPAYCRDGDMVIISDNGVDSWDFARAVVFPANYGNAACTAAATPWNCCSGSGAGTCDSWLAGKITSKYLRYWDLTGDGVTCPYDMLGGTNLAKVPNHAGLVTYNEVVNEGVINHAMSFGYAQVWAGNRAADLTEDRANYGWGIYPSCAENIGSATYRPGVCTGSGTPFSCCTGVGTGTCKAMYEGQRLYLDKSYDCTTKFSTYEVGRIVCEALKEYGMILIVNEGAGTNCIYFENRVNYTAEEGNWTGKINNNISLIDNDMLNNMYAIRAVYPTACTSDTTPPSTPTGLSVSVGSTTTLNVSWTASTDNCTLVKYIVSRCTGVTCTEMAQVTDTITTTSIVDSGLAPSTTYRYKVQAFDASNNASSFSSIASGTTNTASSSTKNIEFPVDALDLTTSDCTGYTTAGAETLSLLDYTSGVPRINGYAYLLADEMALYFCVSAVDTNIQASATSNDTDDILLDDSIELAIDDDGSGDTPYWRIVMGANGYYADYVNGVLASDIMHIRTVTSLNGTLDDSSADTAWYVKGHIPWSSLGVSFPTTATTAYKVDIKLNRKNDDTYDSLYACNTDGVSFYNVAGMCTVAFHAVPNGAKLGSTGTANAGSTGTATLKTGVQ